jgi:serine/threonine-protein kinase HipA
LRKAVPKSDQFCYVYIQMPGTFDTVPCASLRIKSVGANAYEGTFTYGKKYLQRKNVISLDDVHLPLTQQPLKFTKLKGIPGAVRDASPDAWGRRVIQAKWQRADAEIQEMAYLLNGPDDCAGNLSFGLTSQPPVPKRPFNKTHQLQALIDAAEILEEQGRLPHEILENLDPGTSMGGARPKATIEDKDVIWLAKFPERNDKHNLQRIEYATLELARAAGLNVCDARLEKVGRRDVLMLRRFDREWVSEEQRYLKHGFVSGLTVVDAEDGYVGRERWSYLLLADELKRWSSKNHEDRRELFRRMVFNAMVTNNDDHPRNHALLWEVILPFPECVFWPEILLFQPLARIDPSVAPGLH